jgi:hypothetical protein
VLFVRRREATFGFALGPRLSASLTVSRERRVAAVLTDPLLAPAAVAFWCHQQHTDRAIDVTGLRAPQPHTAAGPIGEADALITRDPGVALVVWTADCVPVLMATERAVAAVHAGWRGVASGLPVTVARQLGDGAERSPEVWLGPAIGRGHYPVGPEVHEALAQRGIDPSVWRFGRRVDLRALVSAELERNGCRVGVVGPCTACDMQAASYRRDGVAAGRQWSLAVRTAPVS